MAAMRPSPYNHHGSMPESALVDQLSGMKIGGVGGNTPMMAKNAPPMNAGSMNLKSSQSRGNLPSMPELEYDPFYANQQRFLAQ